MDRWFGGASALLIGIILVVLVLYLPNGIVGSWRAWRMKSRSRAQPSGPSRTTQSQSVANKTY